jgi:hypothetical protein
VSDNRAAVASLGYGLTNLTKINHPKFFLTWLGLQVIMLPYPQPHSQGRKRLTTDQRLDRIERVLILYFNSGRRERKRVREIDEKINILINAQTKNEDGFRKLRKESDRRIQETDRQIQETNRQMREGFRELRDLFWKTDERISRLEKSSKTQ